MKKKELINYKLFLAAVLLIVAGYILLYQSPQAHANFFDDEIFNTRSLVISPIVLFTGYGLIAVSIMFTNKKQEK